MRLLVVDENLPRDFGKVFASHNFEVLDVGDEMRGASDSAIFNFVKRVTQSWLLQMYFLLNRFISLN